MAMFKLTLVITILISCFNVAVLITCQTGWEHFQDSCYLFSTDNATWPEAQRICEDFSGGYLAEVETSKESSYLRQHLLALHLPIDLHNDYWIGGHEDVEGKFWYWAHSLKRFSYADWHPNEPNYSHEHCVQMRNLHGYQWNNIECRFAMRYICEIRSRVRN